MDHTAKILNLPPAAHLNAHHWTLQEMVFKRKKPILDEIETLKIPLKSGLMYKIKMSIFGPFMQELNAKESQNQMFNENKWQILKWQLDHYNRHDSDIVELRNSFLRNHYDLLKKAVNDCETIDLGFFRNNLKTLSLNCCFIKEMDNSLQKFQQLRILTLCGNFLKELPGILLPRTLVFLELFDNLIDDLGTLTSHSPKSLRHLGLGRNQLKEDCRLHLLGESEQLRCLKSIDLSDNDLSDLDSTLECLQNCTSLNALSLDGNPCSLLPNLLTLDGTKILDKDRATVPNDIQSSAQLTFQCFRILGLPEPPKDKKNRQTIHVEVNFPLLTECAISEEETISESTVAEEDKVEESRASRKSTKELKHKEEHLKKAKKHSYFSGENEYDEKKECANFWFKTEAVPWAKIMEFPAIQIGNIPNRPWGIRDTFRSIVPVRIIFLKIAPYAAKSRKAKTRDAKSKKVNKTTKSEIELPNEALPDETCKETILKKLTIASFYCELKSLNWSDETEDFYWADHPDVGDNAIRVNGSLKALDYDLNPLAKKPKILEKVEPELQKQIKEHLPKVLTCQIGFGLNRF